MLSYRRKTPPTILLDTPVIAGLIAGAVILSLLSFLVGRWTAGSSEPVQEQAAAVAFEESPPEPIAVRKAPSIEGDLSFLERIEQDRQQVRGQSQSEPANETKPAAKRPAPREPAPPERSDPEPIKTSNPVPSTEPVRATVETPPPPADNDGWIIQVFASELEARAVELKNKLAKKGYPARVVSVQMKAKNQPEAKTYYRVRVGPYNSKATANRVADRLKSEEKLSTWIFKP